LVKSARDVRGAREMKMEIRMKNKDCGMRRDKRGKPGKQRADDVSTAHVRAFVERRAIEFIDEPLLA
jgi:hypothetical protein